MSFGIEVRTELPSEQWRFLEQVAQKNHTTIGALVREIVRRHLTGVAPVGPEATPGPTPIRAVVGRLSQDEVDQIQSLNLAGKNDSQISKITGIHANTVGKYRDAMGLPKRAKAGRPKKEASA